MLSIWEADSPGRCLGPNGLTEGQVCSTELHIRRCLLKALAFLDGKSCHLFEFVQYRFGAHALQSKPCLVFSNVNINMCSFSVCVWRSGLWRRSAWKMCSSNGKANMSTKCSSRHFKDIWVCSVKRRASICAHTESLPCKASANSNNAFWPPVRKEPSVARFASMDKNVQKYLLNSP